MEAGAGVTGPVELSREVALRQILTLASVTEPPSLRAGALQAIRNVARRALASGDPSPSPPADEVELLQAVEALLEVEDKPRLRALAFDRLRAAYRVERGEKR